MKITNLLITTTILFVFVSCAKETSVNRNKTVITTEETQFKQLGWKLTITATLHRATDDRPRDGKNCGCSVCFGMCDFSPTGEVTGGIYINTSGSGNVISKIYLLDDVDHSESEFGIDLDLIIPSTKLTGGPYSSITLSKGEYEYIANQELIEVNGEEVMSYGFVEVQSVAIPL